MSKCIGEGIVNVNDNKINEIVLVNGVETEMSNEDFIRYRQNIHRPLSFSVLEPWA